MPKPKLYYFDARGGAESVRLLFALGDIEYEDIRIPKEKWPEERKNTPFGFVPVLEVDGKKFAQSAAIGRYVANKIGLAGKTELERLRADMIVDTCGDIKQGYAKVFREQDPEMRKKFMIAQKTQVIPQYVSKLEQQVGEHGWFVGDSMTWADVVVFDILSSMLTHPERGNKEAVDKCPKLLSIHDKVAANPKIAAWIEKRPKTDL